MSDRRVILHVAPHPDDETLGCGGTLLRHIAVGDAVHWVIVSRPAPPHDAHDAIVSAVSRAYGFAGVYQLGFADARLDAVPLVELIDALGDVVRRVEPSLVYLPHPGDAHSDHRAVFEAGSSCTKWFRYPSVLGVVAYETPSETGFGLDPDRHAFRANRYCDISDVLERKLAIVELFGPAEIGAHPFPRSLDGVRALATLRGAESGYRAAEAFAVLRERS